MPPVVGVTGVSIAPKTSSAEAGEAGSRQLSVTVEPSDATNKAVTYSIDNAVGLSVSNNGKIEWTDETPHGTYETTVTTDDGGFSETHTLTLIEVEDPDTQVDDIEPESIDIDPREHTFISQWEPGTSKRFVVTILPEDADRGYTVKSSDESIMRVRIDGDVYGSHDLFATAMSAGTATLTVTTTNGLTATATINVPEQG